MYKLFMYKPFADHPILPLYRWVIPLVLVTGATLFTSQASATESSMEYYHYNHQGSLLEVYDSANKRLLSQAWSPWGERQVLQTNTRNNNTAALLAAGLPVHIGYTGHKELLSTGLTFAGDTRLYDARLKRFLNSDDRTTGGIRGQNRYSYAYNNPMTYIDPDGHAPRRPKYWTQRLGLEKVLRRNIQRPIWSDDTGSFLPSLANIATIMAEAQNARNRLSDRKNQLAAIPLIQTNDIEKYHAWVASFHSYVKERYSEYTLQFPGSGKLRSQLGVNNTLTESFMNGYFSQYYDCLRGNPSKAANIAAELQKSLHQKAADYPLYHVTMMKIINTINTNRQRGNNVSRDRWRLAQAYTAFEKEIEKISAHCALYDYFVKGHIESARELGEENYHPINYLQPDISSINETIMRYDRSHVYRRELQLQ